MKIIQYGLLLALLFFVFSCKKNWPGQSGNPDIDNMVQARGNSFPFPEIPVTLTSPEDRCEYLALHYWDNFDFADSLAISPDRNIEQIWSDYIHLLFYVQLPCAHKSVSAMMTKAAAGNLTVFKCLIALAEKYLYEPDSPTRNEEFYILVLELISETPALTEAEKTTFRFNLEMALKNRVGTRAADFVYTEIDGSQSGLYHLRAEYTLVFFNNPGCHACSEYIRAMQNSSVIKTLLANQQLKILSMYVDEDAEDWKKHAGDFPQEWINGYDKTRAICNENRYDLKAIPALYLLDRNKTVLLKDASLENVEIYLTNAGY